MAQKTLKELRSRRWRWLLAALGLGFATLVIVFIALGPSKALPGEFFRTQGNTHIDLGQEHPLYNSNPPTSGWHTPELNSWGSYDYVIPDERLVHNMEDGGVVLWYSYGTPEENTRRIRDLENVARGYRRVIIVPRDGMPTTYAFTAWQRLERFDVIDSEKMRRFIDAFEGIDHHVRRP